MTLCEFHPPCRVNWPSRLGNSVISFPIIADLTGDGQKETIVGSCDNNVYGLCGNGSTEWSHITGGCVASSSTVTDLNGNGKQKIIVGSPDNKVCCVGLVAVSASSLGGFGSTQEEWR